MPQYMAETRDYLTFKTPNASLVVHIRKNTREIWPCINYHKLNLILVRDAFPYHRLIDEALQPVNNCQWFTSFNLVQGYLQMPVAELDIHKTTFRAGSFGLYEFIYMPFRLSKSGFSFCCLMEMCLGDQQFVTLLLYPDDICVFIASIDPMLDQIEMVFSRPKEFNFKIKPKKCHFFHFSIAFLGYLLSTDGISANPKDMMKN